MFKYKVLKIKDFRNLWLAELITEFSNSFYRWMFMYVVDYLTNDSFTVAITGVIGTIPYILFGPYAGILADRINRKKIMIYSNLSIVLLLFLSGILILWIKTPSIMMLYLMEFIFSTTITFFMPANKAARVMLVPKNYLVEANGLSLATRSVMALISMVAAGSALSMIQKIYPQLFFPMGIFFTASCYLISNYFVFKLPSLTVKEKPEIKIYALKECLEGIRYIKSQNILKVTLLMELLSFFSVSFFAVAYVTANRMWFGGDFHTIVILEVLQSCSLIIGSIWISKMIIKKPSTPFLISTFIISITLFAMGNSQIFWLFAFINVIMGFAVPFWDIPLLSYIQASVPNQFLGRVNSVQAMMTFGIMPIGMFLSGPLLECFGPGTAFMFMGVARMIAAAIGFFHKGFRKEIMPIESEVKYDKVALTL